MGMELISGRIQAVLFGMGIGVCCHATQCQTIADGDLDDVLIWDCGCLPAACDTLLIHHAVTVDGSTLFDQALVHITSTGTLSSPDTLTFIGSVWNEGSMTALRLVQPIGGAPWMNAGSLECSVLWLWGDTSVNTGSVNAVDTLNIGPYNTYVTSYGPMTGDFLWAGGIYNHDTLLFNDAQLELPMINMGLARIYGLTIEFNIIVNESTGTFETDTLLLYGYLNNYGYFKSGSLLQLGTALFPSGEIDEFPGNARIDCGNLKNHGHISGAGDLCIADSSINYSTGTIDGSPDICDATLTTVVEPFVDLNLGSIHMNVNWCAQTACASPISEQFVLPMLHAWPVPAYGSCTIAMERSEEVGSVRLTDLRGRTISMNHQCLVDGVMLDLERIDPGAYAIDLRSNVGHSLGRAKVFVQH